MSTSLFFYLLSVFWMVMWIRDKTKQLLQKDRNEDLQNENSQLIERNNKLDALLEETRAVVITQNDIINTLQDSILPSVVYIAIDPRTGIHYGCFYDKEKAEEYVSTSVDFVIKDMRIEK